MAKLSLLYYLTSFALISMILAERSPSGGKRGDTDPLHPRGGKVMRALSENVVPFVGDRYTDLAVENPNGVILDAPRQPSRPTPRRDS